jgi:hypothetical protein
MTIGLYRTILLPYMNTPRPMAPNNSEAKRAAGLENIVESQKRPLRAARVLFLG